VGSEGVPRHCENRKNEWTTVGNGAAIALAEPQQQTKKIIAKKTAKAAGIEIGTSPSRLELRKSLGLTSIDRLPVAKFGNQKLSGRPFLDGLLRSADLS
jgi:hypothetical protein